MQPELIARSKDNLRHGRGSVFHNWPGFLFCRTLPQEGWCFDYWQEKGMPILFTYPARWSILEFWYLSLMHFQYVLHPGQGHDGNYPGNTGCKAGKQPAWDAGPSQSITHMHTINHSVILAKPTTSMFLEGGNKLHMYMNTWSSGSNPELWSCKTAMLTTAPLCQKSYTRNYD